MTSIATFHTTAHSLVFAFLLLLLRRESLNFVWAAPALGRATFYGKGDGFTLNDGSCACHKRWGWLSNRCESGHCFDYIGSPLPADGDGLVAAINTPGLSNTGQCGVCYDVTCVDGPTRGAPADLWKLAAGVSVCCLFAGLAVSTLVAGVYRKER
ncbi:hypothetical protein WJX79_002140 [Trebouxia sp. C0005]